MRILPAVIVLLALSLPACSAPEPTAGVDTGTAVAPSSEPGSAPSSEPAPPAGDLPAPAGSLPAPAQRTPAPAVTGGGAAAGPQVPPAAADQHADPGAVGVVVNKRRPLTPLDYAPAELRLPAVATAAENALLRPDTAAAVEEMFAAAEGDGVGLVLVSGYRSYASQESTYAYWVGQYGDPAGADTVSARPGYSEHQTGLAFDIGQSDGACTLVLCFRDTPAAQWAAAHAADFGFILRYPLGFHEITGFSAESWHFRYVGKDVSLAMKAAGTQTLEEHFGLPAAPSY